MADTIYLAKRLYEAVLDMTQLPESQLIMLLENPDPTCRMASLWKALEDVMDASAREDVGLTHGLPKVRYDIPG